MQTVLTFSQEVRERAVRSRSRGAGFMRELMTGAGSRDDYVALLVQHYFIYDALESLTERMRADAVAGPFLSPQLTRLPAIEADLEYLVGPRWLRRAQPLPATARYVQRIRTTAEWPAGYVAHHYTRCLGDLTGCHVIRTLLQHQFGFDTNGVGFYLYGDIAEPRGFKDRYRAQLDAVSWSAEERARVIDEVLIAYRLNEDVFDELGARRA